MFFFYGAIFKWSNLKRVLFLKAYDFKRLCCSKGGMIKRGVSLNGYDFKRGYVQKCKNVKGCILMDDFKGGDF